MKRIAIFFTALALLATGCKDKVQKFTLQGDLEAARFDSKTGTLSLRSDALPNSVSIPVENGKFSYSGSVEKPALATLRGGGIMVSTSQVILEKGTITFKEGLPVGTPLNDAASELVRSLNKLAGDRFGNKDENAAKAVQSIRDYLSKHGNDASAIIAILSARRFTTPETMSELIGMTSPEIQNDGSIRGIKNQILRYQKRSEAKSDK